MFIPKITKISSAGSVYFTDSLSQNNVGIIQGENLNI